MTPVKKKIAFFATTNVHKFAEARQVLAEYGIAAALLKLETIEIQDDDIQRIAKASAEDAAKKSSMPILVEDAGLFIEALRGFPGPYSSYVYRTLGVDGMLKLMKDISRRDAFFQSAVAFFNPEIQSTPICFEGNVKGKICYRVQGKQGFGFDPIFEPLGGNGRTFAEMTTAEKNRYSHRAWALRKFAKWYVSQS